MTTTRAGFSLVEVMIVIAILAIVAAMAVPSFEPNVAAQLDSVGEIVAADLAQVRQLAVANNSTYRLTFESTPNRYYWEHTGTNTALNALPPTIFPHSLNTTTRRYVDLDELPHVGPGAFLARVVTQSSTPVTVTALEFGPTGATTQAADTIVWLRCGADAAQRYVGVRVNAVTGLAQVGTLDAVGPGASGS